MSPLTEALLRVSLAIMKNVVALAYASVIVGAALIFSGCSPAGDPSRPEALAFSLQDPDAWDVFEGASGLLEEHSGVQTYSGLAGTTVHTQPRAEGLSTCADTTVSFSPEEGLTHMVDIVVYVPIPEGCYGDPAFTLAHEMIHAIRSWNGLGLLEANLDHSASGVFQAYAGDTRFEETTLNKLCEAADCTNYNPEE